MSGGLLRRRTMRSAVVAAAGAVALAVGLWLDPAAPVRATLVAAILFLGLSLGAMLMLAVGALTGGAWAAAARRPLAAMAAALPVGLVAMVVPLLGLDDVLPWRAATDLPEMVVRKLAYFNGGFILARSLAYAVAWLGMLALIAPGRSATAPRPAVLALVLYGLTVTFFSTDWIMAPHPEFYSSIFPMIEASGEATGALAAAIVTLHATGWLARRVEAAQGVLVAEDLAKLLFGLVLLTAYLAYMQWLVVWSGDLPAEIGWYIDRGGGWWLAILVAIVALHLAVPLVALPSRRLRRSPRGLALVSAGVLLGHALHVVWRIAPSFPAPRGVGILWLAAAGCAVGGSWLAASAWFAARADRVGEAAHA